MAVANVCCLLLSDVIMYQCVYSLLCCLYSSSQHAETGHSLTPEARTLVRIKRASETLAGSVLDAGFVSVGEKAT